MINKNFIKMKKIIIIYQKKKINFIIRMVIIQIPIKINNIINKINMESISNKEMIKFRLKLQIKINRWKNNKILIKINQLKNNKIQFLKKMTIQK